PPSPPRRSSDLDGDRDPAVGADRLDQRDDPGDLLGIGDGLGARPRRLPADVENVRALGDQPARVRQSRGRIAIAAAVREAVGGDVDDPHDLDARHAPLRSRPPSSVITRLVRVIQNGGWMARTSRAMTEQRAHYEPLRDDSLRSKRKRPGVSSGALQLQRLAGAYAGSAPGRGAIGTATEGPVGRRSSAWSRLG